MVLFTNNSKQNYLSAGNCPSTLNNVRFGVEDWVLQGKKQLHSNRNCSLGSGVEPFWGFRRQIFWAFNIIEVTKRLTVTLINYIIGLRSYASLWPTCFSWLIYQVLAKYNTKLTRILHQVTLAVGWVALGRDIYLQNITFANLQGGTRQQSMEKRL